MIAADNPRTYPFTMRITSEERRLLQRASQRRSVSQAEVVRLGLDPILQSLKNQNESPNSIPKTA